MNTLCALFAGISRIPPAVMLIVIIGLALTVAFMVAGQLRDSNPPQYEIEVRTGGKKLIVSFQGEADSARGSCGNCARAS